ncbi:translation initiation factor eIF 4e-like domain-containing protein [Cantharellus anzutake]|uniref:translation initiation factor eIF 4e-like domain-containing protein n=1 Tax=Cantharellus anzutake TaxID=1750568 RepID=UPI001908C594|nr:translation initiation factor eIF 4e-like domain-containing protein [Cantharellus anzutake]KAF8342717.1 translation initiation factor eIF 4e-like domain-containing protein [Cantharellus anzutake]
MFETELILAPRFETPYTWYKSRHETSLEGFLNKVSRSLQRVVSNLKPNYYPIWKYKPSLVVDDGSKPWIWVRREILGNEVSRLTPEALKEATACLQEVTKRVQEITDDASIPVRSNKKTGARSKKELREEIQNRAKDQLKAIATGAGGETVGKWLLYAGPENVDGLWKTVATSVIAGPLSRSPAFAAKVSTSPANPSGKREHVICIYLQNIYDKGDATSVLKILIGDHGIQKVSAKSDLYTHLQLDSKHPSGIRSTIWQVQELLSPDEVSKLLKAYEQKIEVTKAEKRRATETKTKHRRESTDNEQRQNPFESSDDEAPPPSKVVKAFEKQPKASTSTRPLKKHKPPAPRNEEDD